MGPAYLIDLRQIETPDYGAHILRCRIDPTLLIETHDDALNMATWLHRTAGLSLGGRITSHDEPYWAYQIIPALAGLLFAASPQGNSQGIDWVMHAVENPFKPEGDAEAVAMPDVTEAELNYFLAQEVTKQKRADKSAKLEADAKKDAAEAEKNAKTDAKNLATETNSGDENRPAQTPEEDDTAPPAHAGSKELDDTVERDTQAAEVASERLAAALKHDIEIKKAELAEYKAKRAFEEAQAARESAERLAAALKEQRPPEEIRAERLAAGEDPHTVYSELPPSWWDVRQYYGRYPHSVIPTRIERVATLAGRQRDSVALGMSAALFPWVYESVRRQDLPVFDPMWLNDPTATLYILAEPEGGGVGAALPLVQAIVSMWRRKSSMDLLEHNLLLAIDELTNTLPLPTLDVLVSEARGLGINLLVAVQAAQQIAHRYDPIFMDTLLKIFPVALLMFGSAELELLDQASLFSGLTSRGSETFDQTNANRTMSHDEGPLMLPQELQPRKEYHGRLLFRGTAGFEVRLPSLDEFRFMYDNGTIEGLVRI
ncbi:TraM recognition domain-containing protein [Mycobacterium dioxanotrophicus]|uniref:TraM recognition domain-containing protein n=1 Tax=Mycobacterium dioxanotrophicus TaxID=482462 RepID=UPI001E4361CF|nr:TraM recognition domain-containing protein [Mycobacterium dioxanotrophicus]